MSSIGCTWAGEPSSRIIGASPLTLTIPHPRDPDFAARFRLLIDCGSGRYLPAITPTFERLNHSPKFTSCGIDARVVFSWPRVCRWRGALVAENSRLPMYFDFPTHTSQFHPSHLSHVYIYLSPHASVRGKQAICCTQSP